MQVISGADPKSPMAQFLRLMSAQLLSSTARNLRHENMTLAELAALYLLDRDKALRINSLATALALSLPAASRVASTLVDRGFVARAEDPDDRRAKVLTLTAEGIELLNTLSGNLVGEVSRVLATANTPVSNRLAQLFGSMVADGMAAPTSPEAKP
jgi:DNA-binding MarR family transcriptional regulator